MTSGDANFIFLTCKRESTPLLKDEMALRFPETRFSYSRPSFLTYKLPGGASGKSAESLFDRAGKLIFPSSVSLSLGKISAPAPDDMPQRFAEFMKGDFPEKFLPFAETFPAPSRVHFWIPSDPAPTAETAAQAARLSEFLPEHIPAPFPFLPPREGELCLDCAAVSPTEWHVGIHPAAGYHGRFAGGYVPLVIPTDGTSRAWMKFEEGLRWSAFPIGRGSRCADIGASPGGGSQALLARGAEVLGVDPAEMAPVVLKNPDFTHLRGKIGQLKRKLFRKTRWLIGDMNVAPNYTLDVFEELTSAPDLEIRGLLFTLKLFQTELAKNIPEFIDRVRSWGFNQVKVRQLTFNRQEVMLAALKHPFRPKHSR
ncbi:MAG: SAM-dependent methyltransferase [Thermoguttaceae bacterium]|nr:SAM-dependent methyltransferase [Thermoguttaceae bacterium]